METTKNAESDSQSNDESLKSESVEELLLDNVASFPTEQPKPTVKLASEKSLNLLEDLTKTKIPNRDSLTQMEVSDLIREQLIKQGKIPSYNLLSAVIKKAFNVDKIHIKSYIEFLNGKDQGKENQEVKKTEQDKTDDEHSIER